MAISAHPSDNLAAHLARLRRGELGVLATVLEQCQNPEVPASLRLIALREATTHMKRAGKVHDIAATLSCGLADGNREIRLFAAEELAKYYEHTLRDLAAALEIASRARDAAGLARDRKRYAAFAHRVQRLEGKVQRR
jgi:hypothetical protein